MKKETEKKRLVQWQRAMRRKQKRRKKFEKKKNKEADGV